VGADLEVEEAGEEEGAAEVVDEFSDLVSADGDEALVAAVLAVFLLEHDARKPPGAAFLGGDVLAGVGAGDGEDRLVVLGIGAGEAVQVGEGLRPRRPEDGGGGVGEVAAIRGESGEDVVAGKIHDGLGLEKERVEERFWVGKVAGEPHLLAHSLH